MRKQFGLILIATMTLVACSEGDLPNTETTVTQPSVVPTSVEQTEKLTVIPSATSLTMLQSASFNATGGKPPYSYSVVGTGAGALSSNVYAASIVGESVTVRVTDQAGTMVDTTVTVAAPAIVNVYRHLYQFGGVHYYSTGAGDLAGFNAQGIGYRLFKDPVEGKTVALYRCHINGFNLYFNSKDSNCENRSGSTTYQNQALLGYLLKDQVAGSVPVQRFVNDSTVDHIDSITGTSDSEVGGYRAENVTGYALPPQ